MMRFVSAVLLTALVVPAAPAGTNSPALDLARQLNNAFIEVAEKVSPSVVGVKVAQRHPADALDDADNPFWDLVPKELRKQFEEERERRKQESEQRHKGGRGGKPGGNTPEFNGQGSGVIIRDDGYILTNFHVVEDAEKIVVRLRDGRRFEGTVQGKDQQSDIAVIKINATNLPAAR